MAPRLFRHVVAWLASMPARLRPYAPALVIALASAAWGAHVMPHYGITYDEPALLHAGDRTLFALTHPLYEHGLDLLDKDPTADDGFRSEFQVIAPWAEPKDMIHYPVLPGLVCAITNQFFHVRHTWLNAIDGHQLGLVLMHAFALFWFCAYGMRVLGRTGGILAAIFLATYPCALGHSFNDPKDWTCADYYGVTVLAAGAGILEGRVRTILASGVWFGLALSCMFNAVFAFVTFVAWTPIAYLLLYHRRRPVTPALVGAYLVVPYLATAVFVVAWPWLYHGHLHEWWAHLADYVQHMCDRAVLEYRTGWSTYPFRCAFFMTPPVTLACMLAYFVLGDFRKRRAAAVLALLLLWTALPLLRTARPGGNFYDANRHYIEYIPGLCALAGAGAARAIELARQLLDRLRAPRAIARATAGAGAIALATCLVWPIAEYHPFETTYFNVFAGGLGGAERNGILEEDELMLYGADECEADYWYHSLRDALARMDAMAGPTDRIGSHGPPRKPQILGNWTGKHELVLADADAATLLYVAPANGCRWKAVHDLERERPVVFQMKRGGGLVYEILGAKDGKVHPLATPLTIYDTPLAERPNRFAIFKR